MYRVLLSVVSFVSLLILLLILNIASPSSVGPFGILIVFVLIYLSSLGAVTFLIFFGSKISAVLSKIFVFKKPIAPMSFRHSYYFGSMISAAPVILVGLGSVGAVGGYELLLVLIFLVVGCFYVSKRIY